MEIGLTTITGLSVGVIGTGLGGLIIALLGKPSDKVLSGILGFAGGIMLSVIFTDLIPEALEIGGFIPALIGLVVGSLLILSMDFLLPHEHFTKNDNPNSHLIKTGVVLSIGIALHNIPEGLAIGVGYAANASLGYTLALIMLIQNIPEGMAMAAPLYIGGVKRYKIVSITALSGVPMGIGVLIASLFTTISPAILSGGLGFAAGAMLFIVFDEMIPSANTMGEGRAPVVGALIGIFLGVFISFYG